MNLESEIQAHLDEIFSSFVIKFMLDTTRTDRLVSERKCKVQCIYLITTSCEG